MLPYLGASHGEEAPHDQSSCQQAGPVDSVSKQPYGNQGCSIQQLQQAQPQMQHILTDTGTTQGCDVGTVKKSCHTPSKVRNVHKQLLARICQ